MDPELLFVYGTLRRGTGHRMHRLLARRAEFIDTAIFRGRMYLVARYPGVIESDDPADIVIGDVYRLPVSASPLPKLDRYEGCDPSDPGAPYIRAAREVRLTAGRAVTAWVYLYNRSTAAMQRIASGDFLNRSRIG